MREKDEAQSVVYWRIEEWFPNLDKSKVASLKALHDVLLEFCKVSSVISSKSVFVADALYFADAILSADVLFSKQKDITELYDLNQGHGFPTLVWAILRPEIKFVFLTSDLRKGAFIESAVKTLKLQNCTVSSKALDQYTDGSIKNIVHKGTLTISMAILSARKVIPRGGAFFHIKGEEWGIEVAEIPTQLCSLWSPALMGEYRLPIGNAKFSVVKSDKIS